ncbi:MAG: hypothetical protein ACFE9N_12030 [Promethearchaeota archaeon]
MFKNKNLNYIIIILFLISTISLNKIFNFKPLSHFNPLDTYQEEPFDFSNLKISGPEINVTTPEDKTYIKPMSGYYPASYGFENDDIGDNPEEWISYESGGSVNVVDTVGSHKRVVEMHDTLSGVGQNARIHQTILKTSGIIEYWMRIDTTDRLGHVSLMENGNYRISLAFRESGNLEYFNGTWNIISTYEINKWYHVKIEFDVISDWHLWVNGTSIDGGSGIALNGSASSINEIRYATSTIGNTDYRFFVDAIGFSWDPNYNIGYNLNEGLLLSFDLGFTPDWLGYSLDGQITRTILGNYTFPYPLVNGTHTIQVFGNNSIGTMYQSDIRYFYIGHVPQGSPEISGYHIFVILSLISIVSAIIIKKRFKPKS